MEALGFEVMHVYGLTETYGHILQCAWNEDWNSYDEDKKNEIKARQGVRYPVSYTHLTLPTKRIV